MGGGLALGECAFGDGGWLEGGGLGAIGGRDGRCVCGRCEGGGAAMSEENRNFRFDSPVEHEIDLDVALAHWPACRTVRGSTEEGCEHKCNPIPPPEQEVDEFDEEVGQIHGDPAAACRGRGGVWKSGCVGLGRGWLLFGCMLCELWVLWEGWCLEGSRGGPDSGDL